MLVDPSAFASHADRGTLIVTLVLLAGLGLVLVGCGLVGVRRAVRLRRRGVHVPAVVVPAAGHEVHGRLFQDVVYEVPAPDGRVLELVSVGPHVHRHRPGTRAPVVYEPSHPERARADDPVGRLLGPVALLALGLAAWAAALAWVVPNL